MFGKLYGKWMTAWETALTTRDSNRIERPLEWGFEYLAGFGGEAAAAAVAAGEMSGLEAMCELSAAIGAEPHGFFDYATPTDFRIEMRHPELFPTNVRPETLEQEREFRRQAEVGELRREPFLRFTSAVRTPYPENDTVNARWYPVEQTADRRQKTDKARPKQAMIVMPQWTADAFSHNALCTMFNQFGVSCLRLSKPYHDARRPAELERSDYAVSSNVGRTISACRQAVVDIRSCMDWLESQGYTQIGVLGTSLGSCYAFIAAAMDERLKVCAFNHASTWFGDVVWTGQSTRHIQSAFAHEGLTREDVRRMFVAISPMEYMEEFAASDPLRSSLVVYAPYDLTFIEELSLEVLKSFDAQQVRYVAKVLPCGHYTTGESPFKFIDGWYLGSFVYREFKRMR
ncbi:MAG: alpha/beta hydrolase family protein [Bryocella sp.]